MPVVNLKQTRKRSAKAAKAKRAEANRVAHGLTKVERNSARTAKQTHERALDGHKLDR